jgi:Protein of unknown function (DUF3099)
MVHRTRQRDVPLVTEAKRPMSEDIAFRERRYLLMMGIRVLCFILAIVLFVAHAGWLAAIPGVGAIVIPYFAVVFANGGREPSSTRGFLPYEPNLPERYSSASEPPRGWSRSATDDAFIPSGSDDMSPGPTDAPGDYGTH